LAETSKKPKAIDPPPKGLATDPRKAPREITMSKTSAFAFAALLAWDVAADVPRASADPPANTLAEMFGGLRRCLAHVTLEPGTEVTVQFSLNRRGGVIGKPRITYAHWVGDAEAQKKSAAAIAEGFDHCLPLSITDALGGAIAGRMIAFRLRGGPGHEENI
jgi:hypothetical protein